MSEYLFKTDKEIKSCNECPMSELLEIEHCYYCKLLHDIAENNTKISDCPLVEVQTHGRLIDEADLRDCAYKRQIRDRISFHDALVLALMDAPTIIEASTKERE